MKSDFWLTENCQLLTSLYQNARQHHAVLVQTVAGIESKKIIQHLVAWLMCSQPDEAKACGQCHSCQLTVAKHHADIHFIAPESGKRSISIDQVRQLMPKVYERAQQGGRKVFWLHDVDQLNDAAANALLKTIEEPPSETYFILTCRHIADVLPTLRSRCLHVKLKVPHPRETLAWLQTQYPQYSQNALVTALSLCHYAPITTKNLLTPAAWQQRQAFFEQLSLCLPNKRFFDLVDVISHDTSTRLYWLATVMVDAMKYQMKTTKTIINRDQPSVIQQCAYFSAIALQNMHQQIIETMHTLQTVAGVNQALILSNLLLSLETVC